MRQPGLFVLFVTAAVACSRDPEPSDRFARLGPTLETDAPWVVAPLPDDRGYVLAIRGGESLAGPIEAELSVYGAGGARMPHHLFGCSQSDTDAQRTELIDIAPATTRFCHLFVPDAPAVARIVLSPGDIEPLALYDEGDPLGPIQGNWVAPETIDYR